MSAMDQVTPRRIRLPRFLSHTPLAVTLAAGFMVFMLLIMLFARVIQPYAFDYIDLMNRMAPPLPLEGSTWLHPTGTDTLGRDLFSRLLVGTQTSMVLALLGTCLGAVLGVTLGFIAAHKGRLWDEIIMALVDFQAGDAVVHHRAGGAGLPRQLDGDLHRHYGALTDGRPMRASPAASSYPPVNRAMRSQSGVSARGPDGSTCAISCPISPGRCWCSSR